MNGRNWAGRALGPTLTCLQPVNEYVTSSPEVAWNRNVIEGQPSLNTVLFVSLVSYGCRILRLHLCKGVRIPNKCPEYDIKQSDGEVLIMLELWEMQSTSSLASLQGSLCPWVVSPDRVLSMGQIERFDILTECKEMIMLNWIVINGTVSSLSSLYQQKVFTDHIYNMYVK